VGKQLWAPPLERRCLPDDSEDPVGAERLDHGVTARSTRLTGCGILPKDPLQKIDPPIVVKVHSAAIDAQGGVAPNDKTGSSPGGNR
jgi:hypothetical protein